MQQLQDKQALEQTRERPLDSFELIGLLLACAAQIAVLVMTLQDLPGH